MKANARISRQVSSRFHTENDVGIYFLGSLAHVLFSPIHTALGAAQGKMYAHADGNISIVYPTARGSGVLLTAIMAGPLLGESAGQLGAAGKSQIVCPGPF